MLISDCVQLLTLIVVSAYTVVTYRLFSQERDQFRLSLRPWIYPGDISFDRQEDDPTLAVLLYNFGKLPAMCSVSVDKLSITTFPVQKVELVSIGKNQEFPIFPHVQGVDSVFMFLIPLRPDQRIFFMHGSRLEFQIDIKYRTLTEKNAEYTYSYSATLKVGHFKDKAGKQSTLIGNVKAT